jgi:hypothetical protein
VSPQETQDQFIGLLLAGFVLGWVFYLLPTILAFRRRHPDRWLIGVTNLILGATGVGWVVALV